MSPRLISVSRRPSDCSRFRRRLISEGRIPGCALINESVFSRAPPWRPDFADLTDRVPRFTAFCARAALVPVLGRCRVRFIAVVLLPGDTLPSYQWSCSLGKLPLLFRSCGGSNAVERE